MARRMRRGPRRHARGDEMRELRERVEHLEASLLALQDSVYRDLERSQREYAELRTMLEPANLARALSDDARRRGL